MVELSCNIGTLPKIICSICVYFMQIHMNVLGNMLGEGDCGCQMLRICSRAFRWQFQSNGAFNILKCIVWKFSLEKQRLHLKVLFALRICSWNVLYSNRIQSCIQHFYSWHSILYYNLLHCTMGDVFFTFFFAANNWLTGNLLQCSITQQTLDRHWTSREQQEVVKS